MLLLTSTDALRVTTAGTSPDVHTHASYVDRHTSGSPVTPGRRNRAISSATTDDAVDAPAASTHRTVKTLAVRNRHATNGVDVTIAHFDGSLAAELWKVTLRAGDCIHYDEHQGWRTVDSLGRTKSMADASVITAVSTANLVVLASDVVNNNAVANTIQDVTGLSFPVVGGEKYHFEFTIAYTAASTATGSRWCINGPAASLISLRSEYALTTTTLTANCVAGYDLPAASNASSLATGNVATLWGTISPTASGTVIARFASEVAASAITAKAGSLLKWVRTL